MSNAASTCTVPQCDESVLAQGLCTAHYNRARRRVKSKGGDPTKIDLRRWSADNQMSVVNAYAPKGPKKEQILLRLTPDIIKDLELVAKSQKVSVQQMIKRIIGDWHARTFPRERPGV